MIINSSKVVACLSAAMLTVGVVAAPVLASSYPNTRITINARNADLSDLIAVIADQSGINISLEGPPQTRKTTLRLKNVPVQVAMQTIERSYGLQEVFSGGVLHLGPSDIISRAYPTSPSVMQRVFSINNADPIFVATSLQNVLPFGTIVMADPRTSSVLVKGDRDTIASAQEMVDNLDRAHYHSSSYVTESVPVNYLHASDALAILKTEVVTTGSQTLAANDLPNIVLVTGSPDFINTARGLLFNIDRPGKQVRFEVKVTDITPFNESSDVGLLFGGIDVAGKQQPGTGSTFTAFTSRTFPINATLNALVSKAHAKILAMPNIITLENQPATLNVGEQYPIQYFNPQTGQVQVQFINAGVDLTVNPLISENGDVTVNLDTDYSQILSFVGTYPRIGQRHVKSVLRVANDETIVIAGLFQDVTNETVQKIPVLGDIPIIGGIFKNRLKTHSRDEIVFMITPHIITPLDFKPAAQDFKKPL